MESSIVGLTRRIKQSEDVRAKKISKRREVNEDFERAVGRTCGANKLREMV